MRLRLNKVGMDDSTQLAPVAPPQPVSTAQDAQTVVDSFDIFHGQKEVWIVHEGERYRLRITRRGKLILQK